MDTARGAAESKPEPEVISYSDAISALEKEERRQRFPTLLGEWWHVRPTPMSPATALRSALVRREAAAIGADIVWYQLQRCDSACEGV